MSLLETLFGGRKRKVTEQEPLPSVPFYGKESGTGQFTQARRSPYADELVWLNPCGQALNSAGRADIPVDTREIPKKGDQMSVLCYTSKNRRFLVTNIGGGQFLGACEGCPVHRGRSMDTQKRDGQ